MTRAEVTAQHAEATRIANEAYRAECARPGNNALTRRAVVRRALDAAGLLRWEHEVKVGAQARGGLNALEQRQADERAQAARHKCVHGFLCRPGSGCPYMSR
jgi:hypothetical protein